MKLRPVRKHGISVSLSQKFYEKSNYQTQQEIKKLQQQNMLKKEIIRRMTVQLDNLKDNFEKQAKSLVQKQFLKQQFKKLNLKQCKSPDHRSDKQPKLKFSQNHKKPQNQKPKTSHRSKSACPNKHHTQNHSTSIQPLTKQHINLPSSLTKSRLKKSSLDSTSGVNISKLAIQKKPIKVNSNYAKHLETRLKNLAKELSLKEDVKMKLEKRTPQQEKRQKDKLMNCNVKSNANNSCSPY